VKGSMASAALAPRPLLRVFTHPACSGCTSAVDEAWRLTQLHPEVDLRTVSLANKEGLAEARTEKVTVIPTLILTLGSEESKRWEGSPAAGELEASIEAVAAQA